MEPGDNSSLSGETIANMTETFLAWGSIVWSVAMIGRIIRDLIVNELGGNVPGCFYEILKSLPIWMFH
jgi:hypothetical protein